MSPTSLRTAMSAEAPAKAASKRAAKYRSRRGAWSSSRPTEKFDYAGYCQPWGYTRAWQTEYPVELMQTPERVAILWESNNVFHVIPTDGREHNKNQDPSWLGNSIGHYEGDTLVIDTTNFNGKTWIDTAQHPSSDQLHVTERIHYIDADHLAYEVTWEDPKGIYQADQKQSCVHEDEARLGNHGVVVHGEQPRLCCWGTWWMAKASTVVNSVQPVCLAAYFESSDRVPTRR